MYLEIVVAIRLSAGRQHSVAMLRLIAQLARLAMRLVDATIRQPVSRLGRWRERRSAARIARPCTSGRSDDDPDLGWGMLATA